MGVLTYFPTVVKLLLFIYCYSLRQKSSQVRVLWEDHRNDLFINTFGMQLILAEVLQFMLPRYSHVNWWKQTAVVSVRLFEIVRVDH